MLHLTNGDIASEMIKVSGLGGERLAWRDVLHDGPTPRNLKPSEFAKVRAEYIISCSWGTTEEVHSSFAIRDATLENLSGLDELVLWFEHDLYDQLQILQVLDRLADLPKTKRPQSWSMICIGSFPGISKFQGLGQLKPSDLLTLFPKREPITEHQLRLGTQGWRAFCDPTPKKLLQLLKQDLSALPFLQDALIRHLQQFPHSHNGLNQTEQFALQALAAGVSQAGALFRFQNHEEPKPFLGDWSFWKTLQKLSFASTPALTMKGAPSHPPAWQSKTKLTPFGEALLIGAADFVKENGLDEWRGGVHLTGKTVPWRWNVNQQTLIACMEQPSSI